MSTDDIFYVFKVIDKFSTINFPQKISQKFCLNKWILIFCNIACGLLQGFMIEWILSVPDPICNTEIKAVAIHLFLFTGLVNYSFISYECGGQNRFKAALIKINEINQKIKLNFQIDFTIRRYRIALNCIVAIFLASILFYSIHSITTIFPTGIEKNLIRFFSWLTASYQTVWLYFFLIMYFILINLVATQIQSLVGTKTKWNQQYIHLCGRTHELITILQDIFGRSLLTATVANSSSILLVIYNMIDPEVSCIMAKMNFTAIICWLWVIVIIESGERLRRTVRNN